LQVCRLRMKLEENRLRRAWVWSPLKELLKAILKCQLSLSVTHKSTQSISFGLNHMRSPKTRWTLKLKTSHIQLFSRMMESKKPLQSSMSQVEEFARLWGYQRALFNMGSATSTITKTLGSQLRIKMIIFQSMFLAIKSLISLYHLLRQQYHPKELKTLLQHSGRKVQLFTSVNYFPWFWNLYL